MGENSAEKNRDETSIFDRKDPHPERAVKPDPDQEQHRAELTKALKDTFPASDPPAASQPTIAGPKKSKNSEA